jgi:hypothetical protein
MEPPYAMIFPGHDTRVDPSQLIEKMFSETSRARARLPGGMTTATREVSKADALVNVCRRTIAGFVESGYLPHGGHAMGLRIFALQRCQSGRGGLAIGSTSEVGTPCGIDCKNSHVLLWRTFGLQCVAKVI